MFTNAEADTAVDILPALKGEVLRLLIP